MGSERQYVMYKMKGTTMELKVADCTLGHELSFTTIVLHVGHCQYYKKNFNSRFHIIRVVKFRDTTSSTKLDVLDTSFPNKYCHMYMFPIVTVIVFPCH